MARGNDRVGAVRFAVPLALGLLTASSASAGAWPLPEGELIVSQTTLFDWYDIYARNSTNRRLLEEPQGSIVQVGPVRRLGAILTAEYGFSERLSVQLSVAYFWSRHIAVGRNAELMTNAEPNTQHGLQDLTGNVKFLAFQAQTRRFAFAVSPYVGWAIPLSAYDTTVNNPLGDGILQLDFALALSTAFPTLDLYANLDVIYRIRERKAFALGRIHDAFQVIGEVGYFVTRWMSIRVLTRYTEALGGVNLTFENADQLAAAGVDAMQLYQNPLVYNQDALFVGGGLAFQVSKYFGVSVNYMQAVWFRNFANVRTVMLSLSFNPQLGQRPPPEEELAPAVEEESPEAPGAQSPAQTE